MNILLYSTKCPKCKVLEAKLKQSNIEYEEINDVNLMVDKGFTAVPMLEVDGVIYNFKEAVKWIGER